MLNKLFLIFALVLLVGSVSAAGISSPYWPDHPLRMNYGETRVVNFNLQNRVGTEDLTVEVSIKDGSNIASLETVRFTVPAGSGDTMIPLTITIPENYKGGIQRVELEVKTIETGDGMVVLGTGWISSFNVIVDEEPVSKGTLTSVIVGLIIVLIILAVVVFVLIRRRK